MINDSIKNFGEFVMSRFGLSHGLFDSESKASLQEVLNNLTEEIQVIQFPKGELKVWQDPNGTVGFELRSGEVLHYAQIFIDADAKPKWLCTTQNF